MFKKIWRLRYKIIAILLSLIIGGLVHTKTLPFTYTVKGYGDVLESIISFSAIIIGFYTAMYGVLITLQNSDIMKIMRIRKVEWLLKYQLYESLVTSFLILILSIIMQVLKNYPIELTEIIFSIWISTLIIFSASTYGTIIILLKIMFNNKREDFPVENDITQEQKDQINSTFEKR